MLLAQVQTLPAAPRIAPKAAKTVELKLGGVPVKAVPMGPPAPKSGKTLYEVQWRGVSVQAALTGQIGPNQFKRRSPLMKLLEQALLASGSAGKSSELKLGGFPVKAMPLGPPNSRGQTLYEVQWRGVSVQAALTGQIGPNQFKPGSPLKRQLEQALRASQGLASSAQPQSGFGPAFFAGVEGLKGAGAALAGRTGLMNPADAEKVVAQTDARARAIFKPTGPWGVTKLTEMLGRSVPYMAAPLGAAGAVATLPLSGTAATVAGLGAAGVASFTQFTGTNLQRQVAEGRSLARTDLGNAALAAAPMAALDTLSLKMLPGVGSLLSKAGSKVTLQVATGVGEEALTTAATKVTQKTAETVGEVLTRPATQIAEHSAAAAAEAAKHGGNVLTQGASTATGGAAKPAGRLNLMNAAVDYSAATGRAMGVEGSTEAAQQGFERGQAGLSLTDAKARQEYVDSFVGGALLGGAIATPGHLIEHGGRAGRPQPPALAKAPRASQAPQTPNAPRAQPAGPAKPGAALTNTSGLPTAAPPGGSPMTTAAVGAAATRQPAQPALAQAPQARPVQHAPRTLSAQPGAPGRVLTADNANPRTAAAPVGLPTRPTATEANAVPPAASAVTPAAREPAGADPGGWVVQQPQTQQPNQAPATPLSPAAREALSGNNTPSQSSADLRSPRHDALSQRPAEVVPRGLRAILRSPEQDPTQVQVLRREGRTDEEFGQAINTMISSQISATSFGGVARASTALELGWVHLSSGEVLEQPLEALRARGGNLIVDDYWSCTSIPLSRIEGIQVGDLAPEGTPTFNHAAKIRRAVFDQPEAAAQLIRDPFDALSLLEGRLKLNKFISMLGSDEYDQGLGYFYLSELPEKACDRFVRTLFRQFPVLYHQLPWNFKREPSIFRISLEEGVSAEGHMERFDQMLKRVGAGAGTEPSEPGNSPHELREFARTADLMRLEIVRRMPSEIYAISSKERTVAQWRTAAAGDPSILPDAPQEVRDDREVLKRALRLDGEALRHASDRLRADPEVVGWAMDIKPNAYRHALPPLQVLPDVHELEKVLEAFKKGDFAGADAAASAILGPTGSPRRELYLRFVRESVHPNVDVALLVDRQVALAAASNPFIGNPIRVLRQYLSRRLVAEPSFVDDIIAVAPKFWDYLPIRRKTVRPELVERMALDPKAHVFLLRGLYGKSDFDPLASVPPDRWAAVASVHPVPFVGLFRPENIKRQQTKALATGYLAALREDHRLFEKLPSEFLENTAFLAGAVRAAPRLLGTLTDDQRAKIAAKFGSDLAHAEEFARRLGELNLRELHRFDGHDRLLYRVVADRTSPSHDERPTVVVVMPRDDHNRAFSGHTRALAGLGDQFRLAFYEASTVEELGASIAEATRRRPADVVIIGGHGTQRGLQLGSQSEVDGFLAVGALSRLRSMGLHRAVTPGGQVSLISCDSGLDEDLAKNTTNMIADLWPQASVAGMTGSYAGTLEFDPQGRFKKFQAFNKQGHMKPAYSVPARIGNGG